MSSPSASVSGIEHPNVIDVIGHHAASDVVTLVMVENRPWSGTDLQLFQLQEKLNAYLAFALDGEMSEAYPQFVEKPVKIQLECLEPPDDRAVHLLTMVREQIAFRGIDLEVRVTGRNQPAASSRAKHSEVEGPRGPRKDSDATSPDL